MYPTVSIIISTYNWVEALELSLLSITKQTVLPNEVIIADDGSAQETVDLINNLQRDFPVPLIHVWQEDEGFRLAQIRNKAIAQTKCDYIIQIDGDIILNRFFIEDHLRISAPNNFIAGSRVGLNKIKTDKILENKDISLSVFSDGVNNRLNAMRITPLSNYYMYRYKSDKPYYGRGCNMSFWKKDLLAVNGYNEEFKGWGKEDTELMVRLITAGVTKRFIKFGGIAYHLYHKENSRDNEPENIRLLERIQELKITRVEKGVDQYL